MEPIKEKIMLVDNDLLTVHCNRYMSLFFKYFKQEMVRSNLDLSVINECTLHIKETWVRMKSNPDFNSKRHVNLILTVPSKGKSYLLKAITISEVLSKANPVIGRETDIIASVYDIISILNNRGFEPDVVGIHIVNGKPLYLDFN